MYRVGLIGSGFIAKAHAAAYANLDNAKIVAVSSKENTNEFIAEHASGAEPFDDTETLLDEVDPDVVDVCVPTFVHPEVVETAVTRGYDTLCEKPMARTLEEAKQMADLIAENDVHFMVGHAVRFSPAYRRAKELVSSDEVGSPAIVRTSRVGPFPSWSWNNWFADTEKSGGILLDLVIHDFDYLRWTFGEVKHVFTRDVQWEDDGALMEHSVTTLRFENNVVAHVEGSWAQPETREFSYSLEIAGDDGLIEFDGTMAPYYRYTEDEAITAAPNGSTAMQQEIESFLESLETDKAPPISVDDAIEAMRISLAAIQSAERGKPVRVADMEVIT
ncbi:Gfo/Idh/MocA family protein [Haladaptatus sp. NG-SE-30]